MADQVIRVPIRVLPEGAISGFLQAEQAAKRFAQSTKLALDQTNLQTQTLAKNFQVIGRQLGALTGFGRFFGPAGMAVAVGLAARRAVEGTLAVSKSIVRLTHVSKELGLSERDLRAWGFAAERVGISSQAMLGNLQKFSDVTNGLKYNVGGVRNELIRLGAGPVVREIMRTTDQAEKLRVAFRFKDALMIDDPTGFKARMFFEQMGLGVDSVRLSYEEYAKVKGKVSERTDEEKKRAEAVQDALSSLAITWERVSGNFAIALFPKLKEDLENLEAFVNWAGGLKERFQTRPTTPGGPGRTPSIYKAPDDDGMERGPGRTPSLRRPRKTGALDSGIITGDDRADTMLGSADRDVLEGSEQTLERADEEGTFKALVRFASYRQASLGGGGGGGAGGAGGSLSGGGGPAPSQGGHDPNNPPAPQIDMGAALSKGRFPSDLQAMQRIGESGTWGGIDFSGGGAGKQFSGGGALGVTPDESDLSKEAFEKMFANSPLAGKYDQVVAAAKRHGVPAATMAAVMAQETGKGTSSALKNKNNPGGISGSGSPWTFKTLDEGIEKSAEVIGKHYRQGGNRIEGMTEYAPTRNATNDPRGLNKGWIPGVKRFEQQLRGPGSPQTATPQAGRGPGPSFRTERNAEVQRMVGFENAVKNMTPEMQARVMSAYRAMPPNVQQSFVLNEGWRSFAYQKHLHDTRRGRGPVARPGSSRHERGEAIDMDAGPARDWLRRYGHEHGLEGLRGDAPHFQATRDGRRFYTGDPSQLVPVPGQAPSTVTGDYKSKPKIGTGGGGGGIGSDAAIDRANGANRAQSNVNVTVNGSGKNGAAKDKAGPDFAPSITRQPSQMQSTEAPALHGP